jgi:AcrR family transcriptional regulator
MDAGVEVFLEKGFDAATMTEIAARSDTAIGSLYRFFPSKEALADALLLEYTEHVMSELSSLEKKASSMELQAVGDALVEFMLSLQSKRALAIGLIEGRADREGERSEFRDAMRAGIARILRKAIPTVTLAKSRVAAIVLLHILKAAAGVSRAPSAMQQSLLSEIRKLLSAYLNSLASDT